VTEKSDKAAAIPGSGQVSGLSSECKADPADSTASAAVDQAQDDRTAKLSRTRLEQPEGEHGGPRGPEPTRYGDWEKGGRCFDF
jgi:hypothetical protein